MTGMTLVVGLLRPSYPKPSQATTDAFAAIS
jgi:hypothetical protein